MVTSIKLGRSFATPDETLDPTDPEQVMYKVGGTELLRTDGGYWDRSTGGLLSWAAGGRMNEGLTPNGPPTMVQVVYTTQDFRPPEAQLAVVLAVAALYNQRGNEGLKSESLGQYSYTLANLTAEEGPVGKAWRDAVEAHRRVECR